MKRNIKYILLFLIAASGLLGACKKTDYRFGQIVTPSDIVITTKVLGATSADSTGDGSGKVVVTVTAKNSLAYKIFFPGGQGDSVFTTTGIDTINYTTIGTKNYTISVNAVGTGGAMTTASKLVTVTYNFQIPADIIADLTNGSSKNWVIAKNMAGHFGVGPNNTFTPDYYSAAPNDKAATPCAYSGVVTFTLAAPNSITMDDVNAQSFIIGAATPFYGQSGGDGCYVVDPGGTKTLTFGTANTGSNSTNSTGYAVTVPGNGLVGFGTGATSYEIIAISPTELELRDIGSDTNAWYQILTPQ